MRSHRPGAAAAGANRNAQFIVALSVGICIGFCLAVGSSYRNALRAAEECHGHLSHASSADGCPACPACAASDAVDGRPTGELQATLLRTLQQVAPQKEVLVAISNWDMLHCWRDGGKCKVGMLQYWVQSVKNSGVKNYVVVALDRKLADWCEQHDVPYYYKDLQPTAAQMKTGSNHAISGLKFKVIDDFLLLGWNVLLSDVDVIVLSDPFAGDRLTRDADVEGMSDGFDDRTAYGYIEGFDDASMGWARYAQTIRHFVFNSGLFYIRSNTRTVELMQRIAKKLEQAPHSWDQSVYNEEIFFMPHGCKHTL